MNRWMTLSAAALLVASVAQGQQQGSGTVNTTLVVPGHPGHAPVVQRNGRSYVDVEELARITGSTLAFHGSQIVLTLHTAQAAQPSAPPQPPEPTGFTRDFLQAGIEAMSVIREWRAAIENAVRTNNPVDESWVSGFRRAAESRVAQAATIATSDSDKRGVSLLQNQLSNMRQLSDRFLDLRRNLTFVPTNSLDNDPLDQRILACAQGLAGIAVPGGEFQDVAACH